ncbi:MAG: hypothetical protein R3C44_09690 [Chloroflexota bacterium]
MMSIFWARLSPVGSFFLAVDVLFLREELPDRDRLDEDFRVVERLLVDELALTRFVLVFLLLVEDFFAVAIAQMFLCTPKYSTDGRRAQVYVNIT